MKVALIVAYAKNRAIGFQGKIPWHLPEDLKRFKKLTTGHSVVMGRKTYESIGKPLPNRKNIVMTRQRDFTAPGITVVSSLSEALSQCLTQDKVFVMGGGEIYHLAFDQADEMFLTEVDQEPEGDAFFPEWDLSEWRETQREEHPGFAYVNYERKRD